LTRIETREERDRALFQTNPKGQLAQTIAAANPHIVAGVVYKALELQIVMEEFAREQGINFESEQFARYRSDYAAELNRHLDRGVSAFIGAIVSQEG